MLHLTASNLTMYSVPPPGSGAVLAAILNIFQHSNNFRYVKVTLHLSASNLTMYSVPPPGSGAVLTVITQHHPAFRQLPGM
jgi:hypothetical protein